MADGSTRNLLIEIGTEELPPKALRTLGESFARGCVDALSKEQLADSGSRYRWYATPRRLALWLQDVNLRQPDQNVQRRGPALSAAFDAEGNPTPAALGFARSCGVAVEEIERTRTDKGEWLVFNTTRKGEPAESLIQQCVEQSITQLPIPKRMRWSDLEAEFVRPVHWLVIMHGEQLIEASILSQPSGSETRGHRFHCEHTLELSSADDYEELLREQGYVIADYEERKALVENQIIALAAQRKGLVTIDTELLEEVVGLVEWPQAILGEFDGDFLTMPREVLVSSMRDHQKYFHVSGQDGRLLPFFVAVSNIESTAPEAVRSGNERVLRARLADARFFWDTDRKRTLEQHGARLNQVLFHEKLGTVADKAERLQDLVTRMTPVIDADAALCVRAAKLAKADLVTDMVGEFPALQGIMGGYYARHDGEREEVAQACTEHYQPRFSGDNIPQSAAGRVVALADRLDSLLGMFAAGEEPSGDKDPYGLRRAALAVLRIIIEGELKLDLKDLLKQTALVYGASVSSMIKTDDSVVERAYSFIMDRLQGYYVDQGFAVDEIASVYASGPTMPYDFDCRLRAVSAFRQLEVAEDLAAAHKRIRNILRKASDQLPGNFDAGLTEETAEKELADKLNTLENVVRTCFESGQYEAGLNQLASLRDPVDRFFDQVMVMVEDDSVRRNRLVLLKSLQDLFLQVADISYLQETGERS